MHQETQSNVTTRNVKSAQVSESVIRSCSVKDILKSKNSVPFSSRNGWHELQRSDDALRLTCAHLMQGTTPSRKCTKISDFKRYLQYARISKDSLLVVPSYYDDLRRVKEIETPNNEIAFVHQYDPSLPQVFPRIKELTSRLSSCRELRSIFGDTRIINSQREPQSLGRLLQHSKFEETALTESGTSVGVKRCGMRGCGCCDDILEVSSFHFQNSGINFEIKTPMNCTVRNVIYVLQCKRCSQTYIGETVNFRSRMSGHKTSSKDPDSAAEVGAHLNRCGGGFWKLPLFKVKVENKIARLVVEHKLIKMLKPDLNRDTRNLLHLTVGAGNE